MCSDTNTCLKMRRKYALSLNFLTICKDGVWEESPDRKQHGITVTSCGGLGFKMCEDGGRTETFYVGRKHSSELTTLKEVALPAKYPNSSCLMTKFIGKLSGTFSFSVAIHKLSHNG